MFVFLVLQSPNTKITHLGGSPGIVIQSCLVLQLATHSRPVNFYAHQWMDGSNNTRISRYRWINNSVLNFDKLTFGYVFSNPLLIIVILNSEVFAIYTCLYYIYSWINSQYLDFKIKKYWAPIKLGSFKLKYLYRLSPILASLVFWKST